MVLICRRSGAVWIGGQEGDFIDVPIGAVGRDLVADVEQVQGCGKENLNGGFRVDSIFQVLLDWRLRHACDQQVAIGRGCVSLGEGQFISFRVTLRSVFRRGLAKTEDQRRNDFQL